MLHCAGWLGSVLQLLSSTVDKMRLLCKRNRADGFLWHEIRRSLLVRLFHSFEHGGVKMLFSGFKVSCSSMSRIIQRAQSCAVSIKLLSDSIREWRSPLCPAARPPCSPTTCPRSSFPRNLLRLCGWGSEPLPGSQALFTQRWGLLHSSVGLSKSQCWDLNLTFSGTGNYFGFFHRN